jgi:hypothetical protein
LPITCHQAVGERRNNQTGPRAFHNLQSGTIQNIEAVLASIFIKPAMIIIPFIIDIKSDFRVFSP